MNERIDEITKLETQTRSPRTLALTRINLLQDGGIGYASFFLTRMRQCFESWYAILLQNGEVDSNLEISTQTELVRRILIICARIAKLDPTLNEEIGREGSHALISRLVKYDVSALERESDRDTIMELQDFACEIAANSTSFPYKVAPFDVEELRQRLPLSFQIDPVDTSPEVELTKLQVKDGLLVLINQVTERQSAQKDVGFVMWPSAVALSRWIVTNPEVLYDKQILELGAGCGLVGLVAARLKMTGDEGNDEEENSVTITDFNSVVLNNIDRNIQLNGLEKYSQVVGLDFYQQSGSSNGWKDTNGIDHDRIDVVLAADIICQPEDALAAAKTINDSLKVGGKAFVICGDSKHRYGVDTFEQRCNEIGLQVTSQSASEIYEGQLLNNGMEKTTGYVDGMSLTLFLIDKTTQ